jgi:formyl-CoA transferase
VLELGQLLAGPFAGFLLASFGADVIKVEPPGLGDPLRRWRKLHGDTSLWWYALARNKKSITLDLRKPQGSEIVKRLVAGGFDLIIENFRPGRMERWGLGYEDLRAHNPRLVMVRISGYGQTGPYADRPGFANVAEAFGGMRYVTGEPDRPPVRSSVSLGDTLSGLHAAFGAMTAIWERDVGGTNEGQVVDVALYESVFNVMESLLPEYDLLGHVRERVGARLDGVVPSNTYACKHDKYVAIGANGDSIFRRLMQAVQRPDLVDDPRLRHNDGRSQHFREIDEAIEAWTRAHEVGEVVDILERAEVPVAKIHSIADIVEDPHFAARGMLEQVCLPDGTPLRIPGIVPKLSRTPGKTRWVGPALGEHNDEIYRDLLGLCLSPHDLEKLREESVI